MVFVYITCKNKEEAEKVSLHLLKKRLVACANYFPIHSMFWWKEKINKTAEYALLLKTTKKNFTDIKNEVKKVHSYDVACICLIDAKNSKEFEQWVRKEVK